MRVMYQDGKLLVSLSDDEEEELEEELEEYQVIGAMLHELLYADDTTIYSRNQKKRTTTPTKNKTEGAKYGLKLNEQLRSHRHK